MDRNDDGRTPIGPRLQVRVCLGPPLDRRCRIRSGVAAWVRPRSAPVKVVAIREHSNALRMIRSRGVLTKLLRAFCNLGRLPARQGAGLTRLT